MSEPAHSEHVREYVALADLEQTRVRISVSPFPTTFMLALSALATRKEVAGAGPQTWKQAVRAELRDRDFETLAPLADPRTSAWPNILTGSRTPGILSLDEDLEIVLSADLDQLAADIEEGWGERPLDSWSAVRRDPGRWLHNYGEALRRAWRGVEPLWERSLGSLDREIERVGTALAVGAVADCVNALHPRSSIAHGEWRISTASSAGPGEATPEARRWGMASELTVIPLVIEDGCSIGDDNDGDLNQLLYPLPGAGRAFDGDQVLPPAALEALLGPVRARILRRLDRPAKVGEIAAVLSVTPAAATYQLNALESAGLISRRRIGRNVAVERTTRGTGLLDLYAR